MIHLQNQELTVDILDPRTDQSRFGVRYCTGGYIFQVHDLTHGPLLSGPSFPDSFNWFDGQGIPDSFCQNPLFDLTQDDSHALIPGIGLCDLKTKTIVQPCIWTLEIKGNCAHFATENKYGPHHLHLTRNVTLSGRTLRSMTLVHNHSSGLLPLRWFPHPFYPQHSQGQDLLLKMNLALMPFSHTAYELQDDGFIKRKTWPWAEGHFLSLAHNGQTPLSLVQRHPKLGLIGAMCSYAPDFLAIWGNHHSFSWEPYLERTLGPSQSHQWWVDYIF